MATVEAREADPDLASPSAHSTLNRFPFVSTISPPQEAEDVLETNCVRASASDQEGRPERFERTADAQADVVQMPESGHLVMRATGKKVTVRPRTSITKQDYPRLSSYSRLPGLSLGNCMAVHHTGKIYAVSGRVGSGFSPTKLDPDERIKSVMLHVYSLNHIGDELHFIGPPGPVVDMAFTHCSTSDTEFFLGCMDVKGNVGVYRLTSQPSSFCRLKNENIFTWINDGAVPLIDEHPFIRWCPFACPEVSEDDYSKTLLTVFGSKVEVVHINQIFTEGQQTYYASECFSPCHQVFEDHKSTIVDAKISPDGSGFATASKTRIRFYLMEDTESKYFLADSYECGNDDTVINSISFPDDVTDPRSDLYPWSRMIVGLNGNSLLILVDLTEKLRVLQEIQLLLEDISRPMPMAVSPDGKFLLTGINETLFHFDFTSRLISEMTEMKLNLGNDIAAITVVIDCEKKQSPGPSFEFVCQIGGGDFRCAVDLCEPKRSETHSSLGFAGLEEGISDGMKSEQSCHDGDGGAMDNKHCTSESNLSGDNLSEVCYSDVDNDDVIVECIEEDVNDEAQNGSTEVAGHSHELINLETDDSPRNDRHDLTGLCKEVGTNTCDENSPSESVPRMLVTLVDRVDRVERQLKVLMQVLGVAKPEE